MEKKIRVAYDQMNPTPEQEERMLAALQEAQEKMQAQEAGADDVVDDAAAITSDENASPVLAAGSFSRWPSVR